MSDVNNFTKGEWKYTPEAQCLSSNWGDLGLFYVEIDSENIVEIMRFGDSECYYNTCGDDPSVADAKLITTSGTAASRLSDMGYDAVKLIEGLPNIFKDLEFYADEESVARMLINEYKVKK